MSSIHSKLYNACRDGDTVAVRQLLSQGANPQERDSNGESLLHWACSNGQLGLMQYLIENAIADPLPTNHNGDTLLHLACKSGHIHIAQYILQKSFCFVDTTNNNGSTALHWACSNGHIQTVNHLIENAGANVNILNKRGKSAFDCLDNKYKSELKMLFEKHAQHAQHAMTPDLSSSPQRTTRIPSASHISSVSARSASGSPLDSQMPSSGWPTNAVDGEVTTLLASSKSFEYERLSLLAHLQRSEDSLRAISIENRALQDQLSANVVRLRDAESTCRASEDKIRSMEESLARANATIRELSNALQTQTENHDRIVSSMRTEMEEVRMARDAAMARIAILEQQQNQGPFIRFKPHLLHPGLVPSGQEPGRFRVDLNSELHRFAEDLCETGGIHIHDGRQPVVGFELRAVDGVVNRPSRITAFDCRREALMDLRTHGGATFNFNPANFTADQMHVLSALRDCFHEASPHDGNRSVRSFYVFHDCKEANLDGICRSGLIRLSTPEDLGFFGAGFYTTLNIEYAARYAAGDFGGGDRVAAGTIFPVVMLAACVGTAYPITRTKDYTGRHGPRCDYYGEPLERGFDCHVACVSSTAEYEAVDRQLAQYVEVVFDQQTQVLPIAVLWFERKIRRQ